ncbi:hypothetical protein [Rhizobium ruizarguesonis]|uniref:hypothetical protein n=1 Tax=Rhizobium ruizarguesonis TaxID=2081791 RepID=UPI0013B8D9DF|nr:hypothetical protein [Rhizobium ruizarguesonis]NEH61380.1 hypothetical protein [Rhizobium ruizarguesonis]
MVRGPADRRNPFVAATESLCSESEFRSFESNERNLTRVERASKQIAGKSSRPSLNEWTACGASAAPSKIRESEYYGLESLATNIETSVQGLESFGHQSESNERNLFQVAGN